MCVCLWVWKYFNYETGMGETKLTSLTMARNSADKHRSTLKAKQKPNKLLATNQTGSSVPSAGSAQANGNQDRSNGNQLR